MLISPNALPGRPEGRSFIGADHGGMPISLFLVDLRPRSGPTLHRHPYPEIFVLDTGQATFQIGNTLLTAHAGDILIAPAGCAHGFTSTGGGQLRLTAIHTASTIETDRLASDARQPPTNESPTTDRAGTGTLAPETPITRT